MVTSQSYSLASHTLSHTGREFDFIPLNDLLKCIHVYHNLLCNFIPANAPIQVNSQFQHPSGIRRLVEIAARVLSAAFLGSIIRYFITLCIKSVLFFTILYISHLFSRTLLFLTVVSGR